MAGTVPSAAAGSAPVLVACAHGTDDVAGRATVSTVVNGLRRERPDLTVREAFVDVQSPEVTAVVDEITATGGTAVVVPLLLSAGFHVHVDIAEAVADRPAVAAGALGPHPLLVDVLVDRLHQAGATESDAVVLGVAGSSDGRAVVAVEEVAGILRERWGTPVLVGYCSAARPTVVEAVSAARATGAERVVIASYLLAPGYFQRVLLRAGADAVTAPLAPDDRVVQVALERYAAAAPAVRR